MTTRPSAGAGPGMACAKKPLPALMLEYLSYDPSDGSIIRIKSPYPSHIGKRADRLFDTRHSYPLVSFFRVQYFAHRVAWFLYHRQDPGAHHVDHVNGNPLDNRIDNLRLATSSENMWNHKWRVNRSGLPMGVYIQARGGFAAKIQANRRRINLGTYATPEEAHAVYMAASVRLHGEFATALRK